MDTVDQIRLKVKDLELVQSLVKLIARLRCLVAVEVALQLEIKVLEDRMEEDLFLFMHQTLSELERSVQNPKMDCMQQDDLEEQAVEESLFSAHKLLALELR
jgi:hypothetical protein